MKEYTLFKGPGLLWRVFVYTLLIAVLGAFTLNACKKEVDPPPAPEYYCKIIEPENHSRFQAGGNILFRAELSGLGDTASVVFTAGDLLNSRISAPPYEFNWSIPAMLTDTLMVHALATYGNLASSDSILVYIIDTITPGIKPLPVLSVMPELGNIDTVFVFDASQSSDTSTAFEDLLFRFDFEGDGEWDTEFTQEYQYEYKYNQVGNYQAILEVKDTDGLSADTSVMVSVQHSGGPDPCDGYYSVPYGGKIYHTLRIGEQCWLKENLDIGSMIPAGEAQSNNQLIEKYCYNNDSLNCETYGGLYQWKEAMKHIFPIGTTRGICPTGYHIPSNEEWIQLEAHADSQYGPINDIWELLGFRGFDAGIRLKAMLGWLDGGNGNNLTGYKALAVGYWDETEGFLGLGEMTFYSGTEHSSGVEAITRQLSFDENGISKSYEPVESAFSIRCIKD